MVEVYSDCSFVPLEYEHLPNFCTACKTIGHVASTSRHGKPTIVTSDREPKEHGCSRSRKRVYCPITKSPKTIEVPIKNAFSTLKKDLTGEPKNRKVKTRDVANDEDDIANVEFDITLPHNNAFSSQPGVVAHVEAHPNDPSAESKSDSLNTSNLSPLKVFASKDEGWHNVQLKKKKKVAHVQAQYSRPVTQASKSIS
ncbi:Zinc knuckle CX2CX4HX4C [Parasponia andersonii]|uniref:Zinc knuckle CX2CX4HX4C n=1 Tax=Parasponia andersonii TaxID=3476 RepID=A0A2P5DY00_PARAD|nr:Zinc knuckle CX2CX4HX4C [Parasponia andersonii]